MKITLQEIFRSEFPRYQESHGLSKEQYRAANAIMHCGREEMGYEEWVCAEDGYKERRYHSCRHRSCPRCNGKKALEWFEKTRERLLPCDHYHVVLTLPHELNTLWHYNRSWCADRLLKASTETLQQLLKDERYLGGKAGMLAALHTWGRTLSFHPHVHILVTGCGMRGDRLVRAKRNFLLPVGVVKAKFRGKWLAWLNEGYESGDLRLPEDMSEREWKKLLTRISRKEWNVRIEGAYRHGEGVACYLSRYFRGGPIKNERLISNEGDRVGFRYQDYRDGKTKTMILSKAHFLSRVMWHVPPKGIHTVRHYGLYASGAKRKREILRKLLGQRSLGMKVLKKPSKLENRCPKCGAELYRRRKVGAKNSYIKVYVPGIGDDHVQQGVQADRNYLGCSPPKVRENFFRLSAGCLT